MKVAWLLAAFIAIVTYSPHQRESRAPCGQKCDLLPLIKIHVFVLPRALQARRDPMGPC